MSVDISTDLLDQCIRSTYRSSIARCVDRHIGSTVGRYVDRDLSVDISTDTSVEHRPTLDRYVDREWLSDCRPTCRSIGYRRSADTSLLLSLVAWLGTLPLENFESDPCFLHASQKILCINPMRSKSHKPNQKSNWTQSSPIDRIVVRLVIIEAEIFRWVRLIELVRLITEVNNRTRLTRLLLFCLAKRQNPSSFNWIKIKIFILEVIWNR